MNDLMSRLDSQLKTSAKVFEFFNLSEPIWDLMFSY